MKENHARCLMSPCGKKFPMQNVFLFHGNENEAQLFNFSLLLI